jgi:hypothetical protein
MHIPDVILLQLHENTIQVSRKKIEEVIINPVGSQHILFSLQSFCCYACEGFALIFKFATRNLRCKKEICFLL